MKKPYKVLYKGGTGELTEKKSRFIANLQPVKTEEEALMFIEQIRKQYWDAKHHCFAYLIGDDHELQRLSDDGEPSQTAGRPMLDVLLGAGIHNACAVVSRYFGGTLLGTGGLVRAYSGSLQNGLSAAVVLMKYPARKLSVISDYNAAGKLNYLFEQQEIKILNREYTEQVAFTVLAPEETWESLIIDITEVTSGRAQVELLGETSYGILDREVVLLS